MLYGRKPFTLLAALLLAVAFLAPTVSAECGNSQCEEGENSCSCPSDCGKCEGTVRDRACASYYCTDKNICSIQIIPNCCGNDACELNDSYKEDFGNCAADCEPKVVNIKILSPEQGFKARYGEQLFFKAVADADGRSIAGIQVNVLGPFKEFRLFNDGMHDDEGFSDNVFAATVPVQPGSKPGLWDINFLTSFRGVDGKASVQIEVYPLVDVVLDAPAELELGNSLKIDGTFSINGRPVSAKFRAELLDDLNEIIAEKEIESGPEGKFSFEYRSTFVDSTGKWSFRMGGEDAFGNSVEASRSVRVFESGKLPQREITLLKPLKEKYSAGDEIELAVRVEEEGLPLEGANAGAEIFGKKTRLAGIGAGEYAASIELPVKEAKEGAELKVSVFNADGGLVAEKTFTVNVLGGKLKLEVISPEKKLLEIGEAIEFKVLAAYPDESLAPQAEVFAVFNGKKLGLKEVQPGIYSASYKIEGEDEGSLKIIFTAETPEGFAGEAEKTVFVAGKSSFSGFEENFPAFLAGIGAAIIIVTAAAVLLRKRRGKKEKKERLKELDSLERQAQEMYFRRKTINKDEYNKLMEKYSKEEREIKGK